MVRPGARARHPLLSPTPARLAAAAQVKGGTLFVNGRPQVEPFINEKPAYVLDKLVVPPGDVSPPAAVCVEGRQRCKTRRVAHSSSHPEL